MRCLGIEVDVNLEVLYISLLTIEKQFLTGKEDV